VRGESSFGASEKLQWSFGLFHTLNMDDIISVAAPTSGRRFFQNAGDTLRQGIEASVTYTTERFYVYGNYNYISTPPSETS